LLSTEESESGFLPGENMIKKQPFGNKVAVRKYQEKKRAHTAYLEAQVNHLIAVNQLLVKRLQFQAFLNSQVARLRYLVAEFLGWIDTEEGSFPVQKKPCSNPTRAGSSEDCCVESLSGGFCWNTVSIPCLTDIPCRHRSAFASSQKGPMEQSLESLHWQDSYELSND
jgi:hypothetical protein